MGEPSRSHKAYASRRPARTEIATLRPATLNAPGRDLLFCWPCSLQVLVAAPALEGGQLRQSRRCLGLARVLVCPLAAAPADPAPAPHQHGAPEQVALNQAPSTWGGAWRGRPGRVGGRHDIQRQVTLHRLSLSTRDHQPRGLALLPLSAEPAHGG